MKFELMGALSVFCMLLPSSMFAGQYITGELSGVYPTDDYVITGNIYVLPRTTLRFEPGSTLRFENFTGIIIRGELICKGTILRPIKFTSSRDVPNSRIMPESFDWNGIKVMPEAINICLEYCTIAYSTTGLEIASNATPVILKEVSFFHNGSTSLTREREMVNVVENAPISFQWPRLHVKNDDAGRPDTIDTSSPSANLEKPIKKIIEWRNPTLYSTGGLTIASGLFSAVAYGLAWKYDWDYDHKKGTVNNNEYSLLRQKCDRWLTASAIGLGVTCVSAVGFTLIYVF
jgi:hypothetical protein